MRHLLDRKLRMKQQIDSLEVWKDASRRTRRETASNVLSQDAVSRLAFFALLSLCLSLIGCAESNDVGSLTDVAEERFSGIEVVGSVTAVTETKRITNAQDPNMPRQGGVLLIEVKQCGIADPAVDIASDRRFNIFTLINETHAGLTRIVSKPSAAAEPELAESFTVRENGTLYEFIMRKELKFSDGSHLTASDVKWSWERALRKSTGNSRANDVFGDILGAEDVVLGDSREMLGVKVVDENRLTVRLRAPRPDFPILIADPVAYIVNRENIGDWGNAWVNDPDYPGEIVHITGIIPESLPIGAGPFKIVEYAHPDTTREGFAGEARCVLERNEHYWGGPSYLDGIVANVRPDLFWNLDTTFNRQKELLGSGDLDIAIHRTTDMDDLPEGMKQYRGDQPPNVEFLTLNPAQPPLDDLHMRRALAKAIDVKTAIRNVNGSPNQNRLVPRSVSINNSGVTAPDFDIESAKSDLDTFLQSNQVESIEVTAHSTGPPALEFAGVYQSAIFNVWRETLGINVEMHQLDLDEPVQFEELHITRNEFNLYYPSPHGVLREFLDAMGDNDAPEIIEIRRDLAAAAATLDDVQRLQRYEDIEQRLLNDALVVPVKAVEPHLDLLVQPWLHGLTLTEYPNSVFRLVWLRSDAPVRTTQ